MFKIAIITGHGNGDTGAVSKKYGTEANLVRRIAPYLIDQLRKYEDTQVTLFNTKINWYDELKLRYHDFTSYDYVVELHANAGAHDPQGNGHTTGLEIWVPTTEEFTTVEDNICDAVCKKFKIKNRGVKRCDFLVIGEIKRQGVSACLIENGFMDDADDMKTIQNNIKAYSETIADSIAKSFKLKKKSEPKPKPEHKYALYQTSYGNYRVFFLDKGDKIIRHNVDGLMNTEVVICGNRNMYGDFQGGRPCGKSYDLKKKGTHLFVALVDELKFNLNEVL